MKEYTILLPPSEGKAAGGSIERNWIDLADDHRCNAFFELNGPRRQIIDALRTAVKRGSDAELQKLFGVKGDALAAAVAVNARLPAGPLMPAVDRYTGVMFDFIDYIGLAPKARKAFDRHVILFSGLWGLLRPTDPIPDYKLKMDASLPGLGKLSTVWRPSLSAALNPRLADHVVWDLLPNAHAAAWKAADQPAARWRVKFVQRVEKKGTTRYRTVSHWSKALKGALVRFISENGVTDPAAFRDFSHPQGYVYRPEQSEIGAAGGTLVFVKEDR